MAGQVSYTPIEADVVAAARDWFRRALLQPRTRLALFGTALAAALLGAGLTLQGGARPGYAVWVGSAAALGGFILVCLGLALRYALLPGQARRNFRRNPVLQCEQAFAWSDEGISWDSEVANARIAWRDLHRWGEGPSTFLFAVSERGVHFVPRRALSGAEAADLGATARRHGPARH